MIRRKHEKILMKMLSVRAKDRYQDMYDVLADMKIKMPDNEKKGSHITTEQLDIVLRDVVPFDDISARETREEKKSKSKHKKTIYSIALIFLIIIAIMLICSKFI